MHHTLDYPYLNILPTRDKEFITTLFLREMSINLIKTEILSIKLFTFMTISRY
jgi:hypothetical protein